MRVQFCWWGWQTSPPIEIVREFADPMADGVLWFRLDFILFEVRFWWGGR